jgi:anti-anti-sigma factor
VRLVSTAGPPSFEVVVSPVAEGEGVHVAVAGELDLATASEFEATLLEQLAAGSVRLDLRGLSFMDSTGIRVLDALLRDLPMMGSTLLVDPHLQPPVRQILTLTGMIDALPFDDTAADSSP